MHHATDHKVTTSADERLPVNPLAWKSADRDTRSRTRGRDEDIAHSGEAAVHGMYSLTRIAALRKENACDGS
jgi:hypothetical protein